MNDKEELSFWRKMPTVFGEEILESNRKKKFQIGRGRDVKCRETSFPIRTIKTKAVNFRPVYTNFKATLKNYKQIPGKIIAAFKIYRRVTRLIFTFYI